MNYTLDNFIEFCDEYQIANESFSSIKTKLISGIAKLVLFIDNKVKKMKDCKFKELALKLLDKAKMLLAKSKTLNENNMAIVDELTNHSEKIKEDVDELFEKYDNAIQLQIKLVNLIVQGKISKIDVEQVIQKMDEKYGKCVYNSYPVKRKPKPWTKKDLEDLEVLSTSGASSKEFYLYMAEVADYVYGRSK